MMSIYEQIDALYEYVRGSSRPYTGVRWTKNDPLGRIERRVREKVRVKARDLDRSGYNRKARDRYKVRKQSGVKQPLRHFNKKVRE